MKKIIFLLLLITANIVVVYSQDDNCEFPITNILIKDPEGKFHELDAKPYVVGKDKLLITGNNLVKFFGKNGIMYLLLEKENVKFIILCNLNDINYYVEESNYESYLINLFPGSYVSDNNLKELLRVGKVTGYISFGGKKYKYSKKITFTTKVNRISFSVKCISSNVNNLVYNNTTNTLTWQTIEKPESIEKLEILFCGKTKCDNSCNQTLIATLTPTATSFVVPTGCNSNGYYILRTIPKNKQCTSSESGIFISACQIGILMSSPIAYNEKELEERLNKMANEKQVIDMEPFIKERGHIGLTINGEIFDLGQYNANRSPYKYLLWGGDRNKEIKSVRRVDDIITSTSGSAYNKYIYHYVINMDYKYCRDLKNSWLNFLEKINDIPNYYKSCVTNCSSTFSDRIIEVMGEDFPQLAKGLRTYFNNNESITILPSKSRFFNHQPRYDMFPITTFYITKKYIDQTNVCGEKFKLERSWSEQKEFFRDPNVSPYLKD